MSESRKASVEEHRLAIQKEVEKKFSFAPGKFRIWKLIAGGVAVHAALNNPGDLLMASAPFIAGAVAGKALTTPEKEKILDEARRDEITEEAKFELPTALEEDQVQNRMKIRNLRLDTAKTKEALAKGMGLVWSIGIGMGALHGNPSAVSGALIASGIYGAYKGYQIIVNNKNLVRAEKDQRFLDRKALEVRRVKK